MVPLDTPGPVASERWLAKNGKVKLVGVAIAGVIVFNDSHDLFESHNVHRFDEARSTQSRAQQAIGKVALLRIHTVERDPVADIPKLIVETGLGEKVPIQAVRRIKWKYRAHLVHAAE